MRALASLLLAGAVGLGGLSLAPATAEAHGGWRGRDYYDYVPPPPPVPYYGGYGYGGYGYGGYGYGYRPRPFYPRPYAYYRPAPPAFYAPPRAYGIRPGPGVGHFLR